MTEINNNIQNYGYSIERVNTKKDNIPKQQKEIEKNVDDYQYVPDTGVLGRSQICNLKGGDIAKSVDEAVNMAKNEPIRLGCSEALFDNIYQSYLDSGLNESDAYMKALIDEEEFLAISSQFKR